MRKNIDSMNRELARMSKKIAIGYVCKHGHFQFIQDPDGDACSTKRVATVYVKADRGIARETFWEAVAWALDGYHRKMEEWRMGGSPQD